MVSYGEIRLQRLPDERVLTFAPALLCISHQARRSQSRKLPHSTTPCFACELCGR